MSAADKTQVSIRVPAEMLADFERIASALDRDRTWVMVRAFRAYLDGEGAQLLEELGGIGELDSGHGVDLGETLEKADAMVAAALKIRHIGAG